jgi:large exoprotein involved in heme utilization and adhesion
MLTLFFWTIKLPSQPVAESPVNGENEANITLNVRDALILRRNSQISAEASGEQRGGNITINAGAIAAVPEKIAISPPVRPEVRGEESQSMLRASLV